MQYFTDSPLSVMQLRKMYINRVRRNKNDSKLYKVQNQDVTLNRLGSLSDRKMKIQIDME